MIDIFCQITLKKDFYFERRVVLSLFWSTQLLFTFIVIDMYCQITLEKVGFHYEKVDSLSLLYIYSGRYVLSGHFKGGFYIFFPMVIHPSLSFFVFFMILIASAFVI